MDKNFLQDVVPPAGKRTIRNIPIPNHRKNHTPSSTPEPEQAKRPEHATETDMHEDHVRVENKMDEIKRPPVVSNPIPREQYDEEEDEDNDTEEDDFPIIDRSRRDDVFDNKNHHRKSSKKSWPKYSIGAAVLILIFIILSATSKAEITIYPKTATANVDSQIVISEDGAGGSLSYKKVDISDSMSKDVKASGEETVSEKATGTIIIYNSYSTAEQKLIKNTRFETSEGLIFRIEDSVTVPGKTSGNDARPGSVEVKVVADETGDKYNIDLSDFTIPGFKGLEQFDTFYARSKTPMSGGFEGTRKVVSESDLEQVKSELQSTLTESLITKAKSDFSDDFVVLYDADDFVMNTTQGESKGDQVEISLNATLVAYVVNKFDLATALAKDAVVDYQDSETVSVQNIDSLQIEISDDASAIAVSGNPEFKWITDVDELKNKVLGTNRSELKTLLSTFSGISKADAVIKPFWKKTFPKNPEKIEILELSNEE